MTRPTTIRSLHRRAARHDPQEPPRVADRPCARARPSAAGRCRPGTATRREESHGVRPLAVAAVLDVGVGVGVERRRDRDPTGEVAGRSGTRWVIAPSSASELVRVSAPSRGDSRAARPRRASRAAAAGCPTCPRPRTTCRAVVTRTSRPPSGPVRSWSTRYAGRSPVGARHDAQPGHRAQRLDVHPEPLGQGEVVLHEGVLGADPAADHAVAALGAARAARAGAAEVRVARRSRRAAPKKTPTGVLRKVSPTPRSSAVRRMRSSTSPSHGLVVAPEHPLGGVVVRGELGLPVGDVGPLRVLEERPPAARRACSRS